MSKKVHALLIVVAAIGIAIVSYVGAAILLVMSINRFGMTPVYVAMSPHNAYVLWRARRDILWHGIRIRVGPEFVLEPAANRVRVHHVDLSSPLLLRVGGLMFFASNSKRSESFRKMESRCVPGGEEECTIVRANLPSGELKCHRHRGHHARATFGQFELWACEDANGLEAVLVGTPAECLEGYQIVHTAFATAPANIARTSATPATPLPTR
jgi:hypothetical protein